MQRKGLRVWFYHSQWYRVLTSITAGFLYHINIYVTVKMYPNIICTVCRKHRDICKSTERSFLNVCICMRIF